MNDVFTYKNFYGVIHYSSDDDVLFGKIAGIDDLVTFEGETVKEMKEAFENAVDDYIDFCTDQNKLPLKSVKGSLNVRLKPELHLKALIKAETEKKSINKLIQQAVEKEVEDIKVG